MWRGISLLAFLGLPTVFAQGPGDGYSKSTWGANDAISALRWMKTYFPVETAEDECPLNRCPCAEQGRAAVSVGIADEVNAPSSGFGIHTVNCSARPYGSMNLAQVEEIFNDKLKNMIKLDAFMDYNLGIWTNRLDTYVKAFEDGKQQYLALKWKSSVTDKLYYSVIIRIPNTMVIFELISDKSSILDGSKSVVTVDEERLSFTNNYSGRFTIVKISRATSNLDAISKFYTRVLGNRQVYSKTYPDGTKVASFKFDKLKDKMEVMFWQHPDDKTKGDFKVKDYEAVMNGAHNENMKSYKCGFDKWLDHHYAYDGYPFSGGYPVMLDPIVDKLKSTNTKYHLWRMGGPRDSLFQPNNTIHGGQYSLYLVDPTGWAVQLDGPFQSAPRDVPTWDTTLCGQGSC